MKIIKASYEVLTPKEDLLAQVKRIELAGRVCYKSEDKIMPESALPFACKLGNVFKHESVLEHSSLSVRFVCDRGVSHELVRHRLASFSQESTRYCNYSGDKFGNEIAVIKPCFGENDNITLFTEWMNACQHAEDCYFNLLFHGAKPEEARSVLPNSLKTEVVMTANFREWRHVFAMRCAPNAHPQMRELMAPLRAELNALLPGMFEEEGK